MRRRLEATRKERKALEGRLNRVLALLHGRRKAKPKPVVVPRGRRFVIRRRKTITVPRGTRLRTPRGTRYVAPKRVRVRVPARTMGSLN